MERRAVEVCIVGAGPAGLIVAHRLLQANVPCLVLERLDAESFTIRAKAGMLEHASVQALEPYGLAAPILAQGSTNGMVEFRVEGERRIFDYAAFTGGRGHFVYPQHLLVRDWADAFVSAGGTLLFGTEALALDGEAFSAAGSSHLRLQASRSGGAPLAIECAALVNAAGAGAGLVPEGIEAHEHAHPFRWLTTMVEMPPLGERTIYAAHSRGFAAHLRRSPELTRYYLQIPGGEHLSDWPDERVRRELELRLGLHPPKHIHGLTLERDVMDLRVRVREPMQRGSVYLAGDAAHLITPAGGKGMNLAIQDALELAAGLIERFGEGHTERLSRYSDTRLPSIWAAQEFSNWMLTAFCGGALGFQRALPDPAASFARRLHRAQIERLFSDPAFARWFAHRYAGAAD